MLPTDRSSLLFNETPDMDRGPSRDMPNAADLVAMARAIECTAAADDGKRRTPGRSRDCEIGDGKRADRHPALLRSSRDAPVDFRGRGNDAVAESRLVGSDRMPKRDPRTMDRRSRSGEPHRDFAARAMTDDNESGSFSVGSIPHGYDLDSVRAYGA